MKALELKVYPPRRAEPIPGRPGWDGWDQWRRWNEEATAEVIERRGKRFTDAELAAEYWQAEVRLADFMAGLKAPYATDDLDKLEAMDHLVDTICCFAALPNYDEVAS